MVSASLNQSATWFGLGAVAGLGLAVSYYTAVKRRQRKHRAWVLAVNVTFENEDQKAAFLALWKPLLAHVEKEEPGTISYQLLEADDNPNLIMIYERYLSKDHYIEDHRNSLPFYVFKKTVGELPFKAEIVGQSWVEQEMGYMQGW